MVLMGFHLSQLNNVKQLQRNTILCLCRVNNFGTIFRLAPLEYDLSILKVGEGTQLT